MRVGTHLPILAIDLDSALISRLTLSSAWINDDEQWRLVLSELRSSERKYADMVRSAVRDMVDTAAGGGVGGSGTNHLAGNSGGLGMSVGMGGGGSSGGGNMGVGDGGGPGSGWIWLFSVREGKGFLLQNR